MRFVTIIAIAAALSATPVLVTEPSRADPAPDRAAIEAIVGDYILKNPHIIQGALDELQRRQIAQTETRQKEAIFAQKDLIFGGEDAIIVGNPDGDVTLVEFFDYNCGYCKRAHKDLKELIAGDPNLRVVFKEWPFLSRDSFDAAKVSLAVARQGRYEEFHTALLLGRGTASETRALEIAEAMGFDMDRIRADMQSQAVLSTLEENMTIAESIGVTGTPAYVIGDRLILGAQGLAALKSTIDEVRKETCPTC